MGGGRRSSWSVSSSADGQSSLDEDDSQRSSDGLGFEFVKESVNSSGFDFVKLPQMDHHRNPSFSSSPDGQSSLDEDDSQRSSDGLRFELVEESVNSSGFDLEEFPQMDHHRNPSVISSPDDQSSLDGDGSQRSRSSSNHVQLENSRRQDGPETHIINSYKDSVAQTESINEAKRLILSYKPGSWVDKDEDEKLSDFDVPKATTLLLVGFKGSGKSSLINRISRVFEDEKLASDRAQVSYCSSLGNGTYFLRGYMIPKKSSSVCLFDTRSLSNEVHDNDDLIKSWVTDGVCNGELVIRDSDDSSLRAGLQCKIPDDYTLAEPIRKVNFVIFVVDGLSVLRYMNSDKEEYIQHAEMLTQTYNCPYLSFRDDKPVIVVRRGDLMSLEERAKVRIHLGEVLGVPPTTQIFDIPESSDPVTELAILKMLKYALEHADKNLPHRSWVCRNLYPVKSLLGQVFKIYFTALIFLGLALGMNVAIEGSRRLSYQPSCCKSHLDHPVQPQFNSTTQPTSFLDHTHYESLVNGTTEYLAQTPSSSTVQDQEHPETTTETNESVILENSNSITEPNSCQAASSETTTELHPSQAQPTPSQKVSDKPQVQPTPKKVRDKPQVKPTPSQKGTDKVRISLSRFAKHEQRKSAVSEPEPTISWKARQRLWLEE